MRRRTWGATALALAMIGSAAHADTRAGFDLWNKGDYYGAVAQWRPAAVAGDAEAQYNLGQAYKLGRGVPQDLKMAESWYGKAAKQGNAQARDNYGLMLFQNGDRQNAMPYIEEAATRGEPRAQYVLGTALFNGDLVKKDWVRAYALMTRASASGISAASTSLAQMDKFIPLDQRQRGLTMARTMEDAASRPQFASTPGPNTIGNEALPPSSVATPSAGAPPAPVVATDTPARLPTARPVPPRRPMPVERDVQQILDRPGIAPRPAAAAPAVGGRWRVQLGAFSDAGRVNAQWATLRGRIAALAPYQLFAQSAGAVTRLQVGPLPSRAAADALCSKVKAAGNACLPIAP